MIISYSRGADALNPYNLQYFHYQRKARSGVFVALILALIILLSILYPKQFCVNKNDDFEGDEDDFEDK